MAHDKRYPTPIRLALAISFALACHGALAQDAPAEPAPPVAPAAPAAPKAEVEFHEQSRAEAAERQAEALRAAAEEQRAALEAVEQARRELELRAEAEHRRALEARERSEERGQHAREEQRHAAELREEQRALERAEREELRAVERELERAHENLRRASREVARVHRDLNRTRAVAAPAPSFGANPAVIGVILGDSTSEGVRVLGISPDGPAERAGLQQGDVIVSIMDEPLVVTGGDGRVVLGEVMKAVEPGDELLLIVERDGERVEFTVTAEERTPFSWHSVTRIGAPSPPAAPGAPGASQAPAPDIMVQSFAFPHLDPEQLGEELEAMREELEQRHIIIERIGEDAEDLVFEFDMLSDVGDAAIAGTSIWFGMPLTRGLELAELDSGLGAYFETDKGVLVLRARDDNLLQLRSGDVILSVDGDPVVRPADVMRALRRVDTGATVVLEIMRRQTPETLTVVLPEDQFGMRFDGAGQGLGSLLLDDIGGLHLEGQLGGLFVPGGDRGD